jgi:hypothetical protein
LKAFATNFGFIISWLGQIKKNFVSVTARLSISAASEFKKKFLCKYLRFTA